MLQKASARNYTINDGLSNIYDTTNQTLLSDSYSDQFSKVREIVQGLKTFSEDKIDEILYHYYNTLGLNEYYFKTTRADLIAHNMISVMAAKILHENSGSHYFPVIEQMDQNFGFIIVRTSIFDRRSSDNYRMERSLENRYFNLDDLSKPLWRMQVFRSTTSIFSNSENVFDRLKTYFIQKPVFNCVNPSSDELDLSLLLDSSFYLNKKNTITEQIFYNLNKKLVESDFLGLVINLEPRQNNVYRLDIAFKRGNVYNDFYSKVSDMITLHNLYSKSKYVDPLSNNCCIITSFLESLPNYMVESDLPIDSRVLSLVEDIELSNMIPNSQLSVDRKLKVKELVYTHCVSKFIQHFSGSVGPYVVTIDNLAKNQQVSLSELHEIKSKLKVQPYTAHRIASVIEEHVDIVKKLYREFCELHDPKLNADKSRTWVEHTPLKSEIKNLDDLEHVDILLYFRKFNKHTLITNFFSPDKLSLAFRFDSTFLSNSDYPEIPHSIVLILGPHFMGFHIRFTEISRGGIRVVQSFSQEAYTRNKLQIFDETYNLSLTQNLKNKDIPDGGAKGVILLDITSNSEIAERYTRSCFMCYIDAMLDLMMPNEHMVDHLNVSEMYFIGPDEHTGTGGLMDWASLRAKSRGYPYWRSFTTGKGEEMGGIPHDVYGMTTAGIEAYIHELFDKYNLNEGDVTRFLIGGPDGDLGSNAILSCNTKILTVLDKSGTLHDPEGLDLDELKRLALKRGKNESTSSMQYNPMLLSSRGFMVPEDATNLKLPDGTIVKRGVTFRDEFHLTPYAKADLFNPCGGRPSSITPFNVDRLFNENGKCIYKYIVEGSNLFITQNARRFLESRGVILFKDASTNKGGVTSSSFEVLLSLVLDDESFERLAVVKDGLQPEFRKKYVAEILDKIRTNARNEFNALWNEGIRTGMPRCDLTDILSRKIITLKNDIVASDASCEDDMLVEAVLKLAIPESLLKLVPAKDIRKRLPERYLRALFASYIASTFYYQQPFSDDTSVFAFHDFISELKNN